MQSVVLDTNVFVAAGFNSRSSSARLIRAIRDGELRFVWNQATRAETRQILRQIPPLDWGAFEGLFDEASEYTGETDLQAYRLIEDPDDRKFAALAKATGAVLVSNDDDLLSVRDRLDIPVKTPEETARNST